MTQDESANELRAALLGAFSSKPQVLVNQYGSFDVLAVVLHSDARFGTQGYLRTVSYLMELLRSQLGTVQYDTGIAHCIFRFEKVEKISSKQELQFALKRD